MVLNSVEANFELVVQDVIEALVVMVAVEEVLKLVHLLVVVYEKGSVVGPWL